MDNSLAIVDNKNPKVFIPDSIKRLVSMFVKNYLSDCTKCAYEKDIEQFFKFCVLKEYIFSHPRDISSTHFREYRDWLLSEGYQNSSVIRKMASIKQLMVWCHGEGIIDKNPLANVHYPKSKTISTTTAFSDEEVRKLLALPNKESKSGSLHYAILVMLFHIGLRKSELINIKLKDFKEERAHYILTIHGKGDKYRQVPIIPFVRNVLETYKQKTGRTFANTDYLFQPVRNNYSKTINKPLHTSAINWIIDFYSKKAGIEKRVSPHSCRATVVSHLLDNKVPIRDVATFVGHANIQTTSIYDKHRQNLDKSAAYKVQY